MNVSEGAVNLVAERIDLAIRISADPDPALIARPLAVCESVLVAAPAYLEMHGAPEAPSDLEHHACIIDTNFREPNRWPRSAVLLCWTVRSRKVRPPRLRPLRPQPCSRLPVLL